MKREFKVFDCFTFFNELDLLEIRLHEYYDVVDYFVIVEATFTHQNNPKRLFFDENKERFAGFLHKIIHVVVDDKPLDFDPIRDKKWVLENFQRNAIMRGLKTADIGDKILISDLDEIIEKEVLEKAINKHNLAFFGLRHYAYFLNGRIIKDIKLKYLILAFLSKKYKHKYWSKKYWFGPVMANFDYNFEPQYYRNNKDNLKLSSAIYLDCGWHFSYLGGYDKIVEKLNALNQEFDYEPYKNIEYLKSRITNGRDIFNDKTKFKNENLLSLPHFVRINLQNFNEFLMNQVQF